MCFLGLNFFGSQLPPGVGELLGGWHEDFSLRFTSILMHDLVQSFKRNLKKEKKMCEEDDARRRERKSHTFLCVAARRMK